MKLVWTYNDIGFESRKIIIINYYILSITNAKKLGYYTIIYTTSNVSNIFESIADQVIVIDQYENSKLWDSFKFKVLEDRDDEYYLIDGDLILHSKLPNIKFDIIFDAYDKVSWVRNYSKQVNYLTNKGVSKIIPFWDNKRIDIFNCGILRIWDVRNKNIYLDYWKKFNNFILNNCNGSDLDFTATGAQYLLTLLSNNLGLNSNPLSNSLGEQNIYYKHHVGTIKFTNPIVDTKMINPIKYKNLF